MRLFPSKNQWKSWSLPSKLTAIGALVGIISLSLYGLEKGLRLITKIRQTDNYEQLDCLQNWGIQTSGGKRKFFHHIVFLGNPGSQPIDDLEVLIGPAGEMVKDENIEVLPPHISYSYKKGEEYTHLSIEDRLWPGKPIFFLFRYSYNQIEQNKIPPLVNHVQTSNKIYEDCGQTPLDWDDIPVSSMKPPLFGKFGEASERK